MSKKVILALNGELQGKSEDYSKIVNKPECLCIGADGGTTFLESINLTPDVIIGDLDSLSQKCVQKYLNQGVKILKYPVEKDETDGELALEYCINHKYDEVTIVGTMGGRYDQQLANLFLIEFAYKAGLDAVIKEPGIEIGLIKDEKIFSNHNESSLSLIPFSDKVEDVTIEGCKYILDGETLLRYKSTGVSNEITSEKARITKSNGLLLYVLRT